MNMKRKIRRAFKNATPQVLHRISPAPTKVIAMPEAREKTERAPKEKMKLREFVAVAAAMVLIIGSLASGIQFIGQYIQSGGMGVVPTEPPYAEDELTKPLITLAKQCIAPEDVDNVTFVSSEYSTKNPVYRITVKYEGYLYKLSFDKYGELLAIQVTATLDKANRITPSAAILLAYLDNMSKIGTKEPVSVEFIDGVYAITFLYPVSVDVGEYTFYVTGDGEVLDETMIGELVDSEELVNAIWTKVLSGDMDVTVSNAYRQQNTSIVDLGIVNGQSKYRIEIRHNGYHYRYEVNRWGELNAIYLAENDEVKKGYIAPEVALDIVCLKYQLDVDPMQSVNIFLEDGMYNIVVYGTVTVTYRLDATTGDQIVIDLLNSPLKKMRDMALEYHGISLEECLIIYRNSSEEGGTLLMEFQIYTYYSYYSTIFDCSTYEIVGSEARHYEDNNLVAFQWNLEEYVPFMDALSAALDSVGRSLDELVGLDWEVDKEQHIATFDLTFTDKEYSRQINLLTGKVSVNTDLETQESLAILRSSALLHFSTTSVGLPLGECWYFDASIIDQHTVEFIFYFESDIYTVYVDRSTGRVTSSYITDGYLPDYLKNPPAVGWQKARDLAFQELGLVVNDISYLSIQYHAQNQLYRFVFASVTTQYTCCISAVDGSVIHEIELEYVDESVAWDIFMLQLPEDVQNALLSDNDIELSCTLRDDHGAYYYLYLVYEDTEYEAAVDAITGQLLYYEVICPDPAPTPPDGRVPAEYAIEQAIESLDNPNEEKVFVISCQFLQTNEGNYYLVEFFAGNCYYRMGVSAYGLGDLWTECYDFGQALNEFSQIFSSLGSWENMALTHTYESPAQLQLSKFFHNGTLEEFILTADELDQLRSYGYSEEYDIQRMSAVKMEEVLSAYFGCQIEDTNTYGLVYLESTDCYYLWHNDVLAAERFYAFGLIQDGDVYHMYYILQGVGQPHKLTFQIRSDGQIVIYSNLEVDLIE